MLCTSAQSSRFGKLPAGILPVLSESLAAVLGPWTCETFIAEFERTCQKSWQSESQTRLDRPWMCSSGGLGSRPQDAEADSGIVLGHIIHLRQGHGFFVVVVCDDLKMLLIASTLSCLLNVLALADGSIQGNVGLLWPVRRCMSQDAGDDLCPCVHA